MESLRGQLLIAAPQLADPNFRQAVVLRVEHNEDGALGLTLNRPLTTPLHELWQDIGGGSCPSEQPVFSGGPVEGPILCLHRQADVAESEVLPGVFFSGERQHLLDVVRDNRQPFNIYVGYAGWGAGQLEGELKLGGWLTVPATDDTIFRDDSTDLWDDVLRHKGRAILRDTLGIRDFPDEPEWN
ncbi:MAG: YqgE/AlgH family protein [Planctomycetales bacterium]|nr:YqgE/AlgH family protein [Planctomycetales bacterium]